MRSPLRRGGRWPSASSSASPSSAAAVAVVVLGRGEAAPPVLLPARLRRPRRPRPLGEHLLRHVRADRRDARPARRLGRPLRPDRLLRHGLPRPPAGDAGRRAAAVRAEVRPSGADGRRDRRADEPVDGLVQRRDEDLDRASSSRSTRSGTRRLGQPAVLLVSDLDDDAGDRERLTSTALSFRRLGIPGSRRRRSTRLRRTSATWSGCSAGPTTSRRPPCRARSGEAASACGSRCSWPRSPRPSRSRSRELLLTRLERA